MSLEQIGQSIESNEVKVRLQATPEDVEKVKKSIEYSKHLTKANDVLKVLDFPDNREEAFRKILLKQDNNILEELAIKSKNEILTFLVSEKNNESYSEKLITDNQEIKTTKIESEEAQKQSKNNQEKSIETQKNEQKLSKIKSVFTPQILEKNSEIATEFKNLDKE